MKQNKEARSFIAILAITVICNGNRLSYRIDQIVAQCECSNQKNHHSDISLMKHTQNEKNMMANHIFVAFLLQEVQSPLSFLYFGSGGIINLEISCPQKKMVRFCTLNISWMPNSPGTGWGNGFTSKHRGWRASGKTMKHQINMAIWQKLILETKRRERRKSNNGVLGFFLKGSWRKIVQQFLKSLNV